MPPQQVTAGEFEYIGNGLFGLKNNPDITIDARQSAREIKASLRTQGCTTRNENGFQYRLRKREGYPGPLVGGGEKIELAPQPPAPTLELERQLRDWLVHEIEQDQIEVNGVKIKLYKGKEGKEYPTKVGPIDILAIDKQGNFIVFELKLSKGTINALGQIQKYMGWIKQHIAQDKEVRGVIMAQEIDENLKYGVSVNPNITLFKYKLHFTLEESGLN